jgi:hypothetical protein
VNPAFRLTPHEKRTDFTIKDHFQRFSYSIGTLGIPKIYVIAPSFLEHDEGREAILRCIAVLKENCERKGIKPTKQVKTAKGKIVDSKTRIKELEQELKDMQSKLDEVLEENARLQEAVVKLDEINRKMVVDLMKELSARTQDVHRKASTATIEEDGDEEDEHDSNAGSEEEAADDPKVRRLSSQADGNRASIKKRFSMWNEEQAAQGADSHAPAPAKPAVTHQPSMRSAAAAAGVSTRNLASAKPGASPGPGGKEDCSVM